MSDREVPVRFFRLFLDTLIAELGSATLAGVLEKSGLSVDLIDPESISGYTGHSAAKTYTRIQQAVRVYYGRGARGALTRIGRLLWGRLLESASIPEKAQAQLIRTLPPSMRCKPALELLAHFLSEKKAAISILTRDQDLIFVDHVPALPSGQLESLPVCFVTLGLIQENLFWAAAREHEIEEIACCMAGAERCEFRIKQERK